MDKALDEYRTALNGSPEVQKRSHFNTGNVHYRGQNFPQAVEAYKQALRLDDQDLEARQNLELALKMQEQQEQQQQEQQQQDESGDPEENDQNEQDQNQTEGSQDQAAEAQPQGMTREEAERILAALAEMEKAEQQRQQQNQRVRTPGSGKDW